MTEAPALPHIQGLFLGSGSGFAEPGMAERVIELSGRDAAGLELLYLGTATYDRAGPRHRQTQRFRRLGCRLRRLEVATRVPSEAELADAVGRAHVVLASGGNTLYAVDRWVATGLDALLRRAVTAGLVACGGSAGAICWFDGGHSDSMDPTTYLEPVPADDPGASEWAYIRVSGLGLLPGLLCPHYAATGSNGAARAADFERLLSRHAGENGLGLDDWAGLLVDGERYRVVYAEGRPGSIGPHGRVADGSVAPGLWLHRVAGGRIRAAPAPTEGRLADILRPARAIVADPLIEVARLENPFTPR
ncbi:MAG: Type 1 glutamine amidotransferase-like domain-containing protein [Candidatus Limnocylindrales bacterium]